MAVKMIWAEDMNGVLGKDGTIPWDVPGDRRFFRVKTLNHIVVMGRKTWESLPKKPLDGRTNIVLTRDEGYKADGATVLHSVEEVLEWYKFMSYPREHLWIIGGAGIYEAFMPHAAEILVTQVYLEVPGGDCVLAPKLSKEDWVYEGNFTPSFAPFSQSRNSWEYSIRKYTRRQA